MSKQEKNDFYELARHVRGNWGDISPVTKIVQSKKLYSRKKKTYLKELDS